MTEAPQYLSGEQREVEPWVKNPLPWHATFMTMLISMSTSAGREVAIYHDIAELPAGVKSFLSEQQGDELCLSESWFDLLLRYARPAGLRPRIYVVRSGNGDAIDCVMFAMSAVHARRPRKLLSLTNFYTMTFAPIFHCTLSDTVPSLDALARFICRERPAWEIIEFSHFVKERTATRELAEAFLRAGLLVDTYAQYENWFFPTKGMAAEPYFNSRPSQLRNTVRRKTKKARKEHSFDFRLYDSLECVSKGLEDYQKIYARSWKNPEAYPQFIPQLLQSSAARGALRLGVIYIDGDPAAAQIWLLSGSKATIYKLAYDEKYGDLSVGSILTKMMFDYVLDHDRVAEVDYGVGSERYKLDWMSDCRHVVGMICFNPRSAIGALAAGLHYAGRLKRVFHGMLDRFAGTRPIHDAPRAGINAGRES